MSPWARASPIRTPVVAACSCMTPPSSSGTPSMLTPSSSTWASSSAGVARSASASWAAGRTFASAKSRTASWNICCSSSGVTSKRARGLPGARRAGRVSFCAALKVRPAAVAERKPLLVPWKSARSTCLRTRIRSSRSEPASRLSARRPKPMLRSATPLSLPFTLVFLLACWSFASTGSQAAVEMGCLPLGVAHREVRSPRRAASLRNSTVPAAGSACGSAPRRRRRRAGVSPAPPGSAPWSTSRARSRRGSRAASRSASACGSGCGRRRRPRSGGRGRRRAATRRSAVIAGASSSSPTPRRRASNVCDIDVSGPSASCSGLSPRRSIVLTASQAFWRPLHASVTRPKVRPRGCGCSSVGRTTIFSSSPRPIGRCWTIRFSTWTRPTAPKGKRPSAITAMCSGKASTCG